MTIKIERLGAPGAETANAFDSKHIYWAISRETSFSFFAQSFNQSLRRPI